MAFFIFWSIQGDVMSTAPQEEPRQARATVVPMPSRAARPTEVKPPPPPRHEPAEPCEEPGYGHGV